MQYQKLSYPARNYASELFAEYRNRVKENIPDEKASVINFKPDMNSTRYICELQKFFHFQVKENQVIINRFFVDQMTCFYKW